MHLSETAISQAAAILAARRIGGHRGPRLPEECRPADVESALAIQAAVTDRLGERIAGWKCGMPADCRVIVAPIYANLVHEGAGCPVPGSAGQARIEPELAFILGCDLPARDLPYAPAEVDAAIVRTHLALELIGCRYDDPDAAGFAEHLADGLFNQGLLLGPEVDGELARNAVAMPVVLAVDGGQERWFDGRHPAAEPRAPLHWLAEFLRSRGQGLRAGQAVITGSYAGSIDVPAGQEITIRYGALGELAVRFAPR